MEEFEKKACRIAENLMRLWKMHTDDTSVIHDIEHKHKFLQHINYINKAIKCMVEDTMPNGPMPFLDSIINKTPDGIHSYEFNVINTLTHKANTVYSIAEL